jgi:hypothetical protein
MEFLKQCTSLKKPLLEHYLISLLKDLSNKNLANLYELLTIEIGKPKRKLFGIPRRRPWVPQHDKNKVFQTLVNQRMNGLPPKPRDVWDNWKR